MSAKDWLRLHTRSQRVNAIILASRLNNGGFNAEYRHPLWYKSNNTK
jgi:hypothetical protein